MAELQAVAFARMCRSGLVMIARQGRSDVANAKEAFSRYALILTYSLLRLILWARFGFLQECLKNVSVLLSQSHPPLRIEIIGCKK